MNLSELSKKLPSATKPLTSMVFRSDGTKLITIGLNKHVKLSEHSALGRTKLIVIQGKIRYLTQRENITLHTYDTHDIPLEEIHSVETDEDSIFMLLIA